MTSIPRIVARAHRGGRALPPIVVLERPDGYYVVDGRHRVSVARALGHETIDAWASASPSPAPTTPSTKERPMRPQPPAPPGSLPPPLTPAESVHFHAGDHGRPYLCENPHCSSPALHTVQG